MLRPSESINLSEGPGLCIRLVANLHVVRVEHNVLDHILQHRIAQNHWVELRIVVVSLDRERGRQ